MFPSSPSLPESGPSATELLEDAAQAFICPYVGKGNRCLVQEDAPCEPRIKSELDSLVCQIVLLATPSTEL